MSTWHVDLPTESTATPVKVRVTRRAEARVRRGHPWVFASEINDASHDAPAGTLAVVYDRKNRFLAVGLHDPDSDLRLRVLHAGPPQKVDHTFLRARLDTALARRAALFRDEQTDGFRLAHGPNDGLPGLVIDQYGPVLVAKLYSAAWSPWLLPVLRAAVERTGARHVVFRTARATAAAFEAVGLRDGQVIFGGAIEEPVLFRENGVLFESTPIRGQKTGFFLDQRENRARVEALSGGVSVCNVFSFTGGFSVYAARGGARRVVDVDISTYAVEGARRNMKLNRGHPNVARAHHEARVGDAFEMLAAMRRDGEAFDVVIVDPPSFARRGSEVEGALRAYRRLTRAALDVLRPGGTGVFCSCSSRVTPDAFFETVSESARGHGRRLRELERTRQPLDHPATFAEGAYLKALYAIA